jgi:DNA-binding NtrC family response regulator
MNEPTNTVLLIEDDPDDVVLVREALAEAHSARFLLLQAGRLEAGLQQLDDRDVDLVLLDLSLPDSHGLATFATVHARAPHVPIVVLSGQLDEAEAVEAVLRGAQDYLVKGQATTALLGRSIRYALGRKQAEEELRRAKEAAEAASRTLGRLLAEVSRMTRTPLNQIMGLADQLLRTRLDPAQRSQAAAIYDGAAVLLTIIDDILDLLLRDQADRERSVPGPGAADRGGECEAIEGPITVLLIEDNPGDTELVREALADAHPARFLLLQAGRLAAGLEQLDGRDVDAVLLDLSLPDSQGLATYATVHARAPHVPIVVLSGLGDETVAVEAVLRGAQDYLVKGQATAALLGRSIRYALGRKQVEEELRRAKEVAEAASETRGQFLSDLSRVTRMPLNRIKRMTDQLLLTQLTPEQRSHTNTIRSGAEALLIAAGKIVDLSIWEACVV